MSTSAGWWTGCGGDDEMPAPEWQTVTATLANVAALLLVSPLLLGVINRTKTFATKRRNAPL